MKKLLTPTLLLAVILTACTNADPKKMATELCDCVQSKKQVSSKSKKIILKAAKSSDFQETLQEELAAIEDEDEKAEVSEDIQTIALAFQGKKVKECAEEVDKKHRVSKSDEKEMQQKLVDEMENIDDCEVYAAFIKVGLKEQSKNGSDDETAAADEEEETPRKKKIAKEEEE